MKQQLDTQVCYRMSGIQGQYNTADWDRDMLSQTWFSGGCKNFPDSKVHGANMGPIWGRQNPGGHHVGPMNYAIWVICRDVTINRNIEKSYCEC